MMWVRFIVLFWLLLAGRGGLAEPVSIIHKFTGVVQVSTEAGKVPAKKGMALVAGMTITTGDQSSCVLKFADEQVIALTANSLFKIEEYHYASKQLDQSRSFFSLLQGGARFVSGLIAKNNRANFQVQTTVATIGVRGTDFSVITNDQVYTQVESGEIEVSNQAGKIPVKPQERCFITSLSSMPVKIREAELPIPVKKSFGGIHKIEIKSALPIIKSNPTAIDDLDSGSGKRSKPGYNLSPDSW